MNRIPKFIKEFSKKSDQDARDEKAGEIRAKRQEHFSKKIAKQEELAGLQAEKESRDQAIQEKLGELKDLETRLEDLSGNGFKRLVNFINLRKIRADIAIGKHNHDELVEHRKQIEEGITEQEKALSSDKIPKEFQEAKEMLNGFYGDQERFWREAPYTREEVEKYFTEEHLASLSDEEYIKLLKRFPSEMLSHVTRQGIRDHQGHMYHSAGMDEYADGFMKIVEDGQLRSPLSVYLIEENKVKAVQNLLNLDENESREDALDYLERTLTSMHNQADGGSYADKNAIHFACEDVADVYYGSEKGNEVFLVHPAVQIASQHHFRGALHEGNRDYWNDQWVWDNEQNGIDINSGFVFLPAETLVDRETGSRYELDGEGKPIVNEEFKDIIRKFINSKGFLKFAEETMEISGHMSDYNWDKGWEQLKPFREKLEKEYNITDQRLMRAIIEYGSMSSFKLYREDDRIEEEIEDALREKGILFKESQDRVSAKDFWEEYFEKHPGKKPKHIVYYPEQDPTEALFNWKKKHGITKRVTKEIEEGQYKVGEAEGRTNEFTQGFPEKLVKSSSEVATKGLDRFKPLALRAINEYFDEKELEEAS